MKPTAPAAPAVGVFDSGVGGLSVWRALRAALPGAHLHYLADNAWAPYGERDAAALQQRILGLLDHWQKHQPLDLLVIACNSATAVAIDALRQAHPLLPIVGIEPAIRPALAATRSGQVGVVATRATLHSARYAALKAACLKTAPRVQVHEQAADGLADAIERADSAQALALCRTHLGSLLAAAPGIDTLVLGCTHYPLALDLWRAARAEPLTLIDPAEAVARRARSLLPAALPADQPAADTWRSTGATAPLTQATHRWLGLGAAVQALD